jgi:hypothetical protein
MHAALAHPPAASRPPPVAALGPALRRAIRDAPGHVVLRVEEPAPHRRRVARTLLQEGALAAGGQVLDGPGEDLLLVGAEPRRAERLRALLDRLVGAAATQIWSLERDGAALVAYAEGGRLLPPRPAEQGPGLAALDGFLDAEPLGGLVRRRLGLLLAAGTLRPAFIRLEADRGGIAARLGPLGGDADLLDHAVERVAVRLLSALGDPHQARALLGPLRAPRLHLPASPGLDLPGGALPPGALVATLKLAEAAEPAALASRRAALDAAGIGLELDGLGAEVLTFISPSALPAGLFRLHWSPALEGHAALRELDPARLVLAGAPTPEHAARLGIPLVEAP